MPQPPAVQMRRKLDRVTRQLDGRALREAAMEQARQLQRIADEAVRSTPARNGSLADGSMSGWHRGRPVVLATRVTPREGQSSASVLVTPDRTAGLWRVLESGRQGNARGARVARGTTRAGAVRYRRVRRTTGATEAKGTWTRASRMMVLHTERVGRQKLGRVMERALRA
jgi:hypothetical protein